MWLQQRRARWTLLGQNVRQERQRSHGSGCGSWDWNWGLASLVGRESANGDIFQWSHWFDWCEGGQRSNALQQLTYLEAALKETLRLYPPGSFNLRYCYEDVTLSDGTFIPRTPTRSSVRTRREDAQTSGVQTPRSSGRSGGWTRTVRTSCCRCRATSSTRSWLVRACASG